MIAHFDIDAFYASVAQRDEPALRGKPLAIAGSSRRAVVLTASYEARPYGVRSALPLWRAKELCPQLIVAPPDFARYHEVSGAVFAIFERGARAVEGLSLDEAFVATGCSDLESAVAYARRVRDAVRTEVGLTVSAGVATGKLIAKIACDDAKPDGLRAVRPGTEARYLSALPATRLWGVGPKTQIRLASRQVSTIGHVAALSDDAVYELFGRAGTFMRELARGNDPRPVEPARETRSVSSEETFEYDLPDGPELRAALRSLAEDVARRLTLHGLRAGTIGVKVKRSDFAVVGRQMHQRFPTADAAEIGDAARRCLARVPLDGTAVRLLGVRAASLTEQPVRELSLFPRT